MLLSDDDSDTNPSSDLYGDKCVFCGMSGDADKNPNPVSIAHLLKNKADCEEASTVFYSPHDHSNWILLCGAEGYGISSRGQFDKFHMSFRHVTDSDLTSWIVIGGGSRHGRIVKWGSKSSWKDSQNTIEGCCMPT